MTAPLPEVIIGIDLGTTNSLVAVCDEKGPRVLSIGPPIALAANHAMVPSVVRFDEGTVIVGAGAREQAHLYAAETVSSIKRFMGRGYADCARDLSYVTFPIVKGERGDTVRVRVNTFSGPRDYSPEEVSAEILKALKAGAEKALGICVHKAVITVPAYFDDAQRQATRIAGRLAGLEVVRIVPEPTAAALAYGIGLDRQSDRNTASQTVAVFDLGGGTFDVSILTLTPGTVDSGLESSGAEGPDSEPFYFQVLSTSGDTHLGGDDVDRAIVGVLRQQLAEQSPSAIQTLTPNDQRALLACAERLKITLSTAPVASESLTLSAGAVLIFTLTDSSLRSLVAPLLARMLASCEQALRDAKISRTAEGTFAGLDSVILVGGATRMPAVREQVRTFFGIEPYTALNPDEVVALGASVQAALLGGQRRGALLLDVIPLSLGIETVGGAVAKLIARNSMVPTTATEMFSTSVDGQTAIRLTIYQGEREMAADCRKLSELTLREIPPMPAGLPQVQVQFLVDVNGVLNVSAVERRSGKRATLQVVPNHGLTAQEANAIELASFTHAREDMVRHRMIDLITNARLDLKWISDGLARTAALLEPQYKEDLARAINELTVLTQRAAADWQSVQADDLARSKDHLDKLSVRLHETAISQSLRGLET